MHTASVRYISLKNGSLFQLRSGIINVLHFVLKTNDLSGLRDELHRRFSAMPAFFSNEAVVIDIRRCAVNQQIDLPALYQLLNNFKMFPVGVLGNNEQRVWVKNAGFSLIQPYLQNNPKPIGSISSVITDFSASKRAALVVERPLRSGQRIYAKGDIVILGLVSHGAEIIAEGNIHIYAPLRGRALAGVHGNLDARIFCTCLEPELVSIAGIYRTSEIPFMPNIFRKAVQILLKEGKLLIEPLHLN